MSDQVKATIETKQVVVFHLDNEEYAVPIEEVREVVKLIKITPVPNSSEFILGVINLRGKVLPVLDLEKRFHLERTSTQPQQNIVIFDDQKSGLFGVCVDQVTEVLKVPVDLVKPTPKLVTSKISAEFLKGVIVISQENNTPGTERILLLIDLQKIIDQSTLDKLQLTGDDKLVQAVVS